MFGVNDLQYFSKYISEPDHLELIQTIDAFPWRMDLARRTQHYGYIYDYRAKRIDLGMRLGELPKWLQKFAMQLHDDKVIPDIPDQAIINEYLPGQGIADHIDCTPCFGDVVVSLSLAAPVVMDLKRKEKKVSLLLEPRSLLVLSGESRYQWTHGIAKRKYDNINGTRIKRERRLSVTFRKVIV